MEELVSVIFLIGFGAQPQFRRQRNNQNQQQDQNAASTLLQLLPVLLIFFLTAFSMFTTEDDPFSFRKTPEYSMELGTNPHNVKYYVKPETYRRKFSTKRRQADLNNRVESDVISFNSICNIFGINVTKKEKTRLII